MEILLARHGQAAPFATEDDADRPLTSCGRQQTERTAVELLHRGWRPSVIWASPLLRARQTAEIYADTFGMPRRGIKFLDELRPDGHTEPDIVTGMIQRLPPESKVLLVSHGSTERALMRPLLGAQALVPKKTPKHPRGQRPPAAPKHLAKGGVVALSDRGGPVHVAWTLDPSEAPKVRKPKWGVWEVMFRGHAEG